ncbi:MAG: cytochrome P450 [Pseudomonadota bacterium]
MTSVLPYLTGVILAWPLWRTIGRPDVAHLMGASQRARVLVAGIGGFYVIVSLAAFLGPPALQVGLALLSLAILGVFLYCTAPGFGRRGGLPPGSLLPFGYMEQVDDRFLLKQAAQHGGVFKIIQAWQPTICLVGMERIGTLLRQHDTRMARVEMPYSRLIPNGFLRYMGRTAHERYRPHLAKAVALAGDEDKAPVLEASLAAGLARIEVADFAPVDVLPAIVQRLFIQIFFGVAAESDDMHRAEVLYGTLGCRHLTQARSKTGGAALGELVTLVRDIQAQESQPVCALGTLVAEDRSVLGDETVVANLVCMVQVGSHDLASLLVWVWKLLSDNPDWQSRLRMELDRGETGSAGRIISESLRLEQSEYLKRRALETLDFEGFKIPKGWNVQMCLRESHQDQAVFEQPRVFNPDRFLGDAPPAKGYAPFGMGRRGCPAQLVTYLLGTCFLRALIGRYDWQVVREGTRAHNGFHWTPSPAFRVKLLPRSA